MLTFIKLNYKIGDVIEVTCTEGVVKGQMEFVNDRMIVLRQPNGQICGIASGDVHSFRAETPESVVLPPALAADGEVADLLGISQSYISRLEKKIMNKLKKEIQKHY